MAQTIICSGYLEKTGGAGHTTKNTKKRWFTLQSVFLKYYEKPPTGTDGKEEHLCGQLYLLNAKVKEVDGGRISLTTAAGKEYLLHSKDESQVKSWLSALEYSISKAEKFKDIQAAEGWLWKMGGKGHTFKNWKKRWFVLRGSNLSYFSERPTAPDSVDNLCGGIDLASVSQFVHSESLSEGCDKPNFFKVVINNQREYFMAAASQEEKQTWIAAINKNSKILSRQFNILGADQLGEDFEEKVVRAGFLQSQGKVSSSAKAHFVLTNANLRFYKTQVENVDQDYGKDQLGYIPLIGAGVSLNEKDKQLIIYDTRGFSYCLEAESMAFTNEWCKAITKAIAKLVLRILENGETIQLSCDAFDASGKPQGYTLVTFSDKTVKFFYLWSKKTVTIEFDNIVRSELQKDVFCVDYSTDGGQKELRLKSSNAISLYDLFDHVLNAVISLRKQEKESKSPRKSSRDAPERKDSKRDSSDADKKREGSKAALEVPASEGKQKSPRKSLRDAPERKDSKRDSADTDKKRSTKESTEEPSEEAPKKKRKKSAAAETADDE